MRKVSKSRNNLLFCRKTISYEINYQWRRFRPLQLIAFVTSTVSLVVINFAGAKDFFGSNNNILPKQLNLFKDSAFVAIITIVLILAPIFITFVIETKVKQKEANELFEVTNNVVVPFIENELQKLQEVIRKQLRSNKRIRLSVFLPVRKSFFRWRLQMVCKTQNIDSRELEASFCLNEGALGYTFLRAKQYHVEFVDVSNPNNLPYTYVPLSQDNQSLIAGDIKGVIVVAAFQENSIAGFLAIDTDNIIDLQKLKNNDVHRVALSWIIDRRKVIRTLWRMKNNV